MSRTPYMPFFIEPYLADTAGLTLEEQGAYMRLLCHMWINCGKLVDNDKTIARILGVHVNKWRKLRENLGGYLCQTTPGYLSNPRLQKELEKVNQIRTKNAINAQTRWTANRLKMNRTLDASASVSHMPESSDCICDRIGLAYAPAPLWQSYTILIFNINNTLEPVCWEESCGQLPVGMPVPVPSRCHDCPHRLLHTPLQPTSSVSSLACH